MQAPSFSFMEHNGMSKFIFNTARPYQPQGHRYAGQVIEVELVEGFGNIIKYRDLSRGLDGAFYYVHTGLPQSAIAQGERVM